MENQISKEMLIGELVEQFPDKAEILLNYGMHCLGCAIAHGETIEEAAEVHGINIDDLIADLNK